MTDLEVRSKVAKYLIAERLGTLESIRSVRTLEDNFHVVFVTVGHKNYIVYARSNRDQMVLKLYQETGLAVTL